VVEILDEPVATAGGPISRMPPAAVRELPYAAWVTIQTGCDNSCAFCIVPSVRGGEVSPCVRTTWWPRSRPWPDRGVTEVTLLGQNVNSYGRDLTRRRPAVRRAAPVGRWR
jgi:tRNA-2-methylthio-N6-dimethylallyladenosine synthase